MSSRHTRTRRSAHRAKKTEECIYCPLNKPVAWPIVFLLFAFSPFIFANPALNNASSSSPNPQQLMIQTPNPLDKESVLPDNPAHTTISGSSGK